MKKRPDILSSLVGGWLIVQALASLFTPLSIGTRPTGRGATVVLSPIWVLKEIVAPTSKHSTPLFVIIIVTILSLVFGLLMLILMFGLFLNQWSWDRWGLLVLEIVTLIGGLFAIVYGFQGLVLIIPFNIVLPLLISVWLVLNWNKKLRLAAMPQLQNHQHSGDPRKD